MVVTMGKTGGPFRDRMAISKLTVKITIKITVTTTITVRHCVGCCTSKYVFF